MEENNQDETLFHEVGELEDYDAKTKKPKKKGIFGVLAAIGIALSKLKFLVGLLKLGKFLTTFGSMFIMIWAYSLSFGWSFAAGFVILLFIHEMGHWLMAVNVGLSVSAPVFIPFVGAAIVMKEQPTDAVTEAKVALAGPIAGSIGALLCVGLYYLSRQEFFIALAYTGFMINIFNLIPIKPLDGGRIVSAISIKLWIIGIPIAVYIMIKAFNPIILLILILGALEAYSNWRNPNKAYYNAPLKTKIIFAILFFGLITLLGVGMTYIHGMHQGKFLVS